MEIVGRALTDTRHQLGGISGLIILLVGLLGGLAAQGWLFGRDAMLEQWQPAVSALAAYGVLCALFLLVNLAASPFRIQRDRANRFSAENTLSKEAVGLLQAQLIELRKNDAEISLRLQTCFHGDTEHEIFPGRFFVGAIVRVSNAGRTASALDDWSLAVIDEAGALTMAELYHLGGRTTVGMAGSPNEIAFDESQFIYKKTSAPLQPGEMRSGYLFGLVPIAICRGTAILRVWCTDVLGNTLVTQHQMTFDERSDPLRYDPDLEIEILKREPNDGAK